MQLFDLCDPSIQGELLFWNLLIVNLQQDACSHMQFVLVKTIHYNQKSPQIQNKPLLNKAKQNSLAMNKCLPCTAGGVISITTLL